MPRVSFACTPISPDSGYDAGGLADASVRLILSIIPPGRFSALEWSWLACLPIVGLIAISGNGRAENPFVAVCTAGGCQDFACSLPLVLDIILPR
ncbi:hypothetical protein [Nostoc commune]|uniref:hypothetical protein n=1 Tax=Nostoc commune TaxID=1178 RepID=UPI0015E7E9B5|nr:hypothetical protein [Nostoc commune]